MRPKTGFAFFDNDGVFYFRVPCFNSACFRMLLSVPGGTSIFGFPATVTRSALAGMFELTMASFRSRQIPIVVFKQRDYLPYFHDGMIGSFLKKRKPPHK